jgi:hypothetical protein
MMVGNVHNQLIEANNVKKDDIMNKQALNAAQLKKFMDGYNKKVATVTAGESDKGDSPFRRATWSSLGYEYARSEVVRQQVAGQNVVLKMLDATEAQAVWLKG